MEYKRAIFNLRSIRDLPIDVVIEQRGAPVVDVPFIKPANDIFINNIHTEEIKWSIEVVFDKLAEKDKKIEELESRLKFLKEVVFDKLAERDKKIEELESKLKFLKEVVNHD